MLNIILPQLQSAVMQSVFQPGRWSTEPSDWPSRDRHSELHLNFTWFKDFFFLFFFGSIKQTRFFCIFETIAIICQKRSLRCLFLIGRALVRIANKHVRVQNSNVRQSEKACCCKKKKRMSTNPWRIAQNNLKVTFKGLKKDSRTTESSTNVWFPP